MDERPTPRPTPDHPVWGPPRDPLISDAPAPHRPPNPSPARRRHPAARARRIAGWAAVASSAALVGYMVTANAQSGSSNDSTATPTLQPAAPTTPTTSVTLPATTQNDDDDETVATVPAATTPVQLPVPSRHQQPQFGGQPNSSTHGS